MVNLSCSFTKGIPSIEGLINPIPMNRSRGCRPHAQQSFIGLATSSSKGEEEKLAQHADGETASKSSAVFLCVCVRARPYFPPIAVGCGKRTIRFPSSTTPISIRWRVPLCVCGLLFDFLAQPRAPL